MPRPHRVLAAALAAVLAVLLCAPEATADEWVIVVDADTGDAPALDELPAPGRALWAALTKQEAAVRLLAARHPVLALTKVLAKADEDAPQQVVYLGAFDALPEAKAQRLERAKKAWSKAPEGSRLLPLDGVTADALEALDGLEGLTTEAVLLIAFGEPTVEDEPFSPLDPEAHLRATVTVPVTELRLAATPEKGVAVPLVGTPQAPGDTVIADRQGKAQLAFRVKRTLDGSRKGTLAFMALDHDDVVRIAEPPATATWTWDGLEADVRIRGAEGGAAEPFDATDAEVDAPREVRYRVVATKPARASLEPQVFVDDAARAVPGLRAWVTAPTERDAEVLEAVLHVRYAPRPASPQDVEGEVRIGGQRVRFHVSADRGRATLGGTPGAPFALPLAAERDRVTFQVATKNGNMPKATVLTLSCEPEAYAERVRLRLFKADGTEQRVAPGSAFRVGTGAAIEAVVELTDGEAWAALEPGTLAIRPATQDGVTVEGALELPFRFRQARLVVQDEDVRYRVADDAVEAIAPLRLVVDADGGDGAWLLARLAATPRVAEQGDAPLADWTVVDEGGGTWRVEATGPWRGPDAEPFDAQHPTLTFDVTWDGGAAPGPVEARVEVPARWGTRGWIFVGLAVLAIALGVGTFLQLRAAPVRGTLLYAVQGLERTVGRVDLTPIGRRAVVLRSDERGRVDIGDEGEAIGTIRPTRVGAMLEVPGEDGTPERRLLVDGLSLKTGRHTLRYVSGDADEVEAAMPLLEVPDLLGPEFDLESGAVDALP